MSKLFVVGKKIYIYITADGPPFVEFTITYPVSLQPQGPQPPHSFSLSLPAPIPLPFMPQLAYVKDDLSSCGWTFVVSCNNLPNTSDKQPPIIQFCLLHRLCIEDIISASKWYHYIFFFWVHAPLPISTSERKRRANGSYLLHFRL